MKLSMTIMAILWSSAFGLGLMNFIQSSSPVAGPVYPDCLQFYQAKPGDSCQSIADAHSITLLDFIWMNEAMAWYWVKGGELSSTASPPSASQYANNVVDKRSMIPSYPTKRSRRLVSSAHNLARAAPTGKLPVRTAGFPTKTEDVTATTAPPEPACELDECAVGLQMAVDDAASDQRQFCTSVIEPVCRHYELQNMDLPKSLNGMCKQRNLCQDISSVCSCWRKEKTTLGLRREQLWWRRNMNVKVPVLRM
ncbi:putative class V chitinase [Colletotrichum asianum]|uniref:Putative class V chitinase n=1 Tax=Colletotrichum asianum TaxID=702518 RepID=A0A8H3W8R9_9PEZI|nr:putative class V chitinase [Colletotrichum asianum]